MSNADQMRLLRNRTYEVVARLTGHSVNELLGDFELNQKYEAVHELLVAAYEAGRGPLTAAEERACWSQTFTAMLAGALAGRTLEEAAKSNADVDAIAETAAFWATAAVKHLRAAQAAGDVK